MSKEGFVIIPQYRKEPVVIKEDITPYAYELKDCIVFEDDRFAVYQPNDPDQLIELSADTKWLYSGWNYSQAQYNDIDYDHRFLQPDLLPLIYVIVDKNARTAASKKYLFQRGYGEFLAPSGANYAGATYIFNTGDEKLWKWFIDQNFQFITTNLQKKVGGKLIKNKSVLVYPTDFVGETKMKLTWAVRIDSDITEIQIVPGTKKIKAHAFEGLRKVKRVVMPDSVVSVGSNLFYGCNNLEEVTLSNSLKEISANMFSGCCSLKTIKIPSSVTSIGVGAFYGYGYSSTHNSWGVNSNLTEIEIPASVKTIGTDAFYSCRNLRTVILHEGLESIGRNAFCECISLKNINLPDSLKQIDAYAFAYTEMKQLYIPKNVETVGESILCTKVNRDWHDYTSIKQPAADQHILCGVESKPAGWNENFSTYDINRGEGYYDRNVGRYVYPEIKKTYINVTWGASRPSVNEDLDTTEFAKPQSCLVYQDDRWDVFCPKTLNEMESVCDYIGAYFSEYFTDCLDDFNTQLQDSEEDNRKAVDKMIKQNRYTIFNDKAEGHQYIYSDIRFSLSGTNIHTHFGYLFDENGEEYHAADFLKYYNKGGELLQMLLYDKGTPGLITWACNRWKQGLAQLITKNKVDKILGEVDNVITYGTDTYNLIQRAGWKEYDPYYRIKTGVPLSGRVLENNIKVDFPKGTKKIKARAFDGWTCLTDIDIPEGVTMIDDYAFNCDTKLASIRLPDSLEYIGECAFIGCSSLKEIFIPKSVTTIKRMAFWGCDNVTIKCEAENKPADWDGDWDTIKRKPSWYMNNEEEFVTKAKVEWGCKRN